MKTSALVRRILPALLLTATAAAQDVAPPLTIQGLDMLSAPGARARGTGQLQAAMTVGPAAAFTNPALAGFMEQGEAVAGWSFASAKFSQTQLWVPNELYADMSILFETGAYYRMIDSVTRTRVYTQHDRVSPDWERSISSSTPEIAAASIPVGLDGVTLVPGLAFARLADLSYYYRNSNALAPNIGQMRPAPIPRPRMNDSILVRWYQWEAERTGALYGITPSLAVRFADEFSAGLSVAILTGSSDDLELGVDRGMISMSTSPNSNTSFNNYRVDSSTGVWRSVGESKYTGFLSWVGFAWQRQHFRLGVVFRPPATITRTFTGTLEATNGLGTTTTDRNVTNELHLPFGGTVGITFFPFRTLTVGAELDVRNYDRAELTQADGSTSEPWADGVEFRVAAEYRPDDWLALRAGVSQDNQVFAPAGSGLPAEPAGAAAYHAGAGFFYGDFRLDASYEYSKLLYQDAWLSNVNDNTRTRSRFTVELGYIFR